MSVGLPARFGILADDDRVDRMDAVEDAIDAQRRMIEISSSMVALNHYIKLHPSSATALDELDEVCAQALVCVEQIRMAILRFRDCT